MTFANSFNVARRLSAKNENDLLQDDFTGTYVRMDSLWWGGWKLKHVVCVLIMCIVWTGSEENERLNCQALADRLVAVKDLPRECLAYNDVINSILRRNTKSDNAIAFQGMQPGSAQSAMAARGKGRESHAQIQRRYTNSRRFSKQEK